MKAEKLDQDNAYFSTRRHDSIVEICFKENQSNWSTIFEAPTKLFDYLHLISIENSVKVVVLVQKLNGPVSQQQYFKYYDLLMQGKIDPYALRAFYTSLDLCIQKIVESNKMFIGVLSGKVIPEVFITSFACDYRIVADNTVVQKPEVRVGMVPKGTATFLLNKTLEPGQAYNLLLSEKDISAHELLRLGLTDKVVPFNKLETTAMEIAKNFACKSTTSLAGAKKLMNYSLRDTKGCLKFENEKLLQPIEMIQDLRAVDV